MFTYDSLHKTLQQAGASLTASETHGLFCGLLCVPTAPVTEEIWLTAIFAETSMAEEYQQSFLSLKNETLAQLRSLDYDFIPLLPDEETSLAERAQALGLWCEGFLFGLGLTKLNQTRLSTEAQEFLRDVVAISRIAPVTEETEAQETEFMQLFEYLKVGVLNFHEELTTLTSAKYHNGHQRI